MAASTDPQLKTRDLLVAYDNWKSTTAIITTSDAECPTTVYTIEFHLRTPNIIMKSATTAPKTIAHVSFHTFSTKIDIDFYPESTNTHSITLQLKSVWSTKSEYSYCSPSLDNKTVTWQSQASIMKAFDFVLLDDSAMPLARFSAAGARNNWKAKRIGKIELMPSLADKEDVADEIVATTIAIVQYHMAQSRGASSAAVTAAST